MEKYITREQLADFVMKMWEANIRVETHPRDNYISLWSNDAKKHIYIGVIPANYETLISDIVNEMKEE